MNTSVGADLKINESVFPTPSSLWAKPVCVNEIQAAWFPRLFLVHNRMASTLTFGSATMQLAADPISEVFRATLQEGEQ